MSVENVLNNFVVDSKKIKNVNTKLQDLREYLDDMMSCSDENVETVRNLYKKVFVGNKNDMFEFLINNYAGIDYDTNVRTTYFETNDFNKLLKENILPVNDVVKNFANALFIKKPKKAKIDVGYLAYVDRDTDNLYRICKSYADVYYVKQDAVNRINNISSLIESIKNGDVLVTNIYKDKTEKMLTKTYAESVKNIEKTERYEFIYAKDVVDYCALNEDFANYFFFKKRSVLVGGNMWENKYLFLKDCYKYLPFNVAFMTAVSKRVNKDIEEYKNIEKSMKKYYKSQLCDAISESKEEIIKASKAIEQINEE